MEEDTMKEKIKPKHTALSNVWFMVKLAWDYQEKKVLLFCLLTAGCHVIRDLIELYSSPTILAVVERHGMIWELFLTIAGFVLGKMLVSAALEYIQVNELFGKVTIRSYIIYKINKKAATTSYVNVDDAEFQNLLTKTQDATCSNNTASEQIWDTLTKLLQNVFGVLIYATLISKIHPLFVVVIAATTMISYAVTHYVNEYGYRHKEEEAEYSKKLYYLEECAQELGTAKDIRIFGLRDWLESIHDKTMCAYLAFREKAENMYIWGHVTNLIMTILQNGLTYIYLINLVVQKELDVAQFLLLFSAVSGFAGWVSGILNDVSTLHRQSLDISCIRECLEYREPFLFEKGKAISKQEDTAYEICLEHVSFRYPNAEKDTLTDIDLTLKAGEKLAVVGLNGAGKTTLVKLICGFLDPTTGRVLLNGTDIREYNRLDYYRMFSAVFQNFSVLASTIAANVAQTEDHIDMERVAACIEKAGLKTKIESLPKGYDTHLNHSVYDDAMMLSGGETQRLMLARALYKDAPFIVLDEPTAALNPIAEANMYQTYHEMTKGKSSVYISHRLASTRFCDRIILLDHAKICEEGTHEQLLELGGKYAELYEVQSKYYKEEGNADEEA